MEHGYGDWTHSWRGMNRGVLNWSDVVEKIWELRGAEDQTEKKCRRLNLSPFLFIHVLVTGIVQVNELQDN